MITLKSKTYSHKLFKQNLSTLFSVLETSNMLGHSSSLPILHCRYEDKLFFFGKNAKGYEFYAFILVHQSAIIPYLCRVFPLVWFGFLHTCVSLSDRPYPSLPSPHVAGTWLLPWVCQVVWRGVLVSLSSCLAFNWVLAQTTAFIGFRYNISSILKVGDSPEQVGHRGSLAKLL